MAKCKDCGLKDEVIDALRDQMRLDRETAFSETVREFKAIDAENRHILKRETATRRILSELLEDIRGAYDSARVQGLGERGGYVDGCQPMTPEKQR